MLTLTVQQNPANKNVLPVTDQETNTVNISLSVKQSANRAGSQLGNINRSKASLPFLALFVLIGVVALTAATTVSSFPTPSHWCHRHNERMVHFHGHPTRLSSLRSLSARPKRSTTAKTATTTATESDKDNIKATNKQYATTRNPLRHASVAGNSERPPDPNQLLQDEESTMSEYADRLAEWFQDKSSVLCVTGAGLSTASGIPDYRGHNGSYHRGHKPILHRDFMENPYHRKRYWARGMVGWSSFDQARPNTGHAALSALEQAGKIGVQVEDRREFYDPINDDDYYFSSGQKSLSIITQNVDSLHERSGTKHVIPLHGSGNLVRCMSCGKQSDRNAFHDLLHEANHQWLEQLHENTQKAGAPADQKDNLRPDGDAQLAIDVDYNQVCVPNCPHCQTGIIKPDVVFFGDTVPKHRVALCQEAVKAADAILVVGTSLAVHSAFRHVRAAYQSNVPVAIVNVGPTRIELETSVGNTRNGAGNSRLAPEHHQPETSPTNVDGRILKLEGPAGTILSEVVSRLQLT